MSILLTILTVLAGLIALLLIIGLFSKKGYSLQREITIDKPRRDVFNYVKLLKNQDHFNKWVMMDPAMKKEFRGTDGEEGFVYAWDGNNKAGAGEQEIKKIMEGERVDMEIRFKRPFKGIASAYMITGATANGNGRDQTSVRWGMSSQMNYPMNVMLLFMNMDKMLGKDLESSLIKLKGILETR
jgi:uncharacterized protein YndB with AHSA1/START domain